LRKYSLVGNDFYKMKHIRRKIFITLWVLIFIGIGATVWFFYSVFKGAIGYMPSIEQLENPVNKFASQIFTADGKQIGTWSYSQNNRILVDYDELSPWLIQALVATEDERFFEHSGIDYRALTRAIVKRGLLRQRNAGGGSTITQQLAKQLFSERVQNEHQRLMQKPIEWAISLKLEQYYTKEEIITMYLSYFDFLHNAVGIKSAASIYFNGKEPKDLDINEAAMLVGMCKNPSLYNPVSHPERCEQRRNIVLDQMLKAGYLTTEQADSCKAMPLAVDYKPQDFKAGDATYLREFLRQVLMAKKPVRSQYPSWQNQKFYEDSLAWECDPLYGWCNKNTKRDGTPYNLYTDGLRIYTSVDSRMQEYAESSLLDHINGTLQPAFEREMQGNPNAPYARNITSQKRQQLVNTAMRQSSRWAEMKRFGCSEDEIIRSFNEKVKMNVYTLNGPKDTTMTPLDSLLYYKRFLRSSFMCMDNATGDVKAYVGGVDYAHFQYDMVSSGKRQVGSTIKPYLYSLAMDNGMTPCDEVLNVQRTYNTGAGTWTPRNSGSARIGELVTLRWALQNSNNWISAYLINELSPEQFVNTLHQFGIKDQALKPSLSLCLGTCDISLLEMVSAYTAFTNKGICRHPRFVTRIEDANGNVIADFRERDGWSFYYQPISESSSYRMISMMRAVMDGGTGSRMRNRYGITAPMAGKTGTTNDNSDGWFVGYTPQLTFGAWIGGDERSIHFGSMANGQGAAAALPIAAMFMQKVYKDKSLGYSPDAQFNIPVNHQDCQTYDGNNEDIFEGEDYDEMLLQ